MKEIFISYSSVDLAQATAVRTVLENNGLSCWMAPRDIAGGSNYTKEIPVAIRNCKVFVLVFSENAQRSHWVLKELDSAVNSGKVILPLMLEDLALNDEFNFLLTGVQRYAAYQKNAQVMEDLVCRIRSILEIPSEPTKDRPQTDFEAIAASEPDVTDKKAPAESLEDAKCPACHGSDLKELKGKVKCTNLKEHLIKLLIPALSILCMVFCFILAVIAFLFEYMLFFALGGAVLGAVWGIYLSRKIITRSRLRSGFSSTCYRCKRCGKVFDAIKPLDN